MSEIGANPTSMYLPLLTHAQPEVRRQACTIMLGTYGGRALSYLRRLLDVPDLALRQQARAALLAVGEITGLDVEIQPFAGMYVECLGRLRVYIGNREVLPEDWMQHERGRAGWQKVQAVFAYLLHCGRRGAARDSIRAAVWGGPVSPSSLSRTLTTLRQVLAQVGGAAFVEQALTITHDVCALAPEVYHTDVQLFERAFNMACRCEETAGLAQAAPPYTQAMQLYGGPYMADMSRSGHWAQPRGDQLMNNFVIAAERLAEHAYTSRDYWSCVTLCRQALDADPAADDVLVWMLRAFAALDLAAELEHAYRGYLRAAALDPRNDDEQDPVVRTYRELIGGRALGAV